MGRGGGILSSFVLKQKYKEVVKLSSTSIPLNIIGAGLPLHKDMHNLSVDTKAARISVSRAKLDDYKYFPV
jgi:hypothetical protein